MNVVTTYKNTTSNDLKKVFLYNRMYPDFYTIDYESPDNYMITITRTESQDGYNGQIFVSDMNSNYSTSYSFTPTSFVRADSGAALIPILWDLSITIPQNIHTRQVLSLWLRRGGDVVIKLYNAYCRLYELDTIPGINILAAFAKPVNPTEPMGSKDFLLYRLQVFLDFSKLPDGFQTPQQVATFINPIIASLFTRYKTVDISTLLPNISSQVYLNSYTYLVDRNFGNTYATTKIPTVAPTGFTLDIVENNVTSNYPLYCYESDYTQGVTTTGNTLTMNYTKSGNLQLNVCKTKCTSGSCDWQFFDILGQNITFNVNLSQIPCNYNLTFYSVTLQSNRPYCDAQSGCTEVDFMEANAYAWHTTIHTKTDPSGTPIGYGGTVTQYTPNLQFTNSSGTDPNKLYGPGLFIDTTKEFQASISFQVDNNNILTQIKTVLTQGTNQIFQTYPYDQRYFEDISKQLQSTSTTGNVFIMSLWTGGLAWLQSPPCASQQYKPTSSEVLGIISDIQISTIL